MTYAEAQSNLTKMMRIWKPEGEVRVILNTCLDALSDCIEKGIVEPQSQS